MGDIILLTQNEIVPCNLLILTNHYKTNMSGDCFVSSQLVDESFKVQVKLGIDKLRPKCDLKKISDFKKYFKQLNFSLEILYLKSD
jgi:hypothetical protein